MKASYFIRPGLALVTSLALSQSVLADSATWSFNPISADWNTAANWIPSTVPNGPADTATFDVSDTTTISLSARLTEVSEVIFNPDASSFKIIANSTGASDLNFVISGAGITNNSSLPQRFLVGSSQIGYETSLVFRNAATIGSGTILTVYGASSIGTNGATVEFEDDSTAGDALGIAQGALAGHEAGGGVFVFNDNSSAANARFRINGALVKGGYGGGVSFYDSSSAADGVFVINPAAGLNRDSGSVGFSDLATAGNGRFIFRGSTVKYGEPAAGYFGGGATASHGLFAVNGAEQPGTFGSTLRFSGYDFTGLITTAGEATIVNNGGNGPAAEGGRTSFGQSATAGQARIIANGGENGGGGGRITFDNKGDGGAARFELHGNGSLDISYLLNPSLTIGSLTGDGFVYLASRNLTVGSNDLDAAFSGVIQEEGGGGTGTGGSLTKIGKGTLTLRGASTYTGGTTVEGGVLRVRNTIGSATGRGDVQVNDGTFGGSGTVAGAITIGDADEVDAILHPSVGSNHPTTLTVQGSATFKSDSTYHYELDATKRAADTLNAEGASIESGAEFEFVTSVPGELPLDSSFTVIRNTAATPIAGTFANLADGTTITSSGNNFQASYSGNDGNDLTLTVVE